MCRIDDNACIGITQYIVGTYAINKRNAWKKDHSTTSAAPRGVYIQVLLDLYIYIGERNKIKKNYESQKKVKIPDTYPWHLFQILNLELWIVKKLISV